MGVNAACQPPMLSRLRTRSKLGWPTAPHRPRVPLFQLTEPYLENPGHTFWEFLPSPRPTTNFFFDRTTLNRRRILPLCVLSPLHPLSHSLNLSHRDKYPQWLLSQYVQTWHCFAVGPVPPQPPNRSVWPEITGHHGVKQ